jgi:hypothetical protein
MKIEKNKIVFASVIGIIFLFLISYCFMILDKDKSKSVNLEQTQIPDLKEPPQEYDSKLDAINDIIEVRQHDAPSMYSEKFIDSLGFYDPNLPENEKERIVDSIYLAGKIKYSDVPSQSPKRERFKPVKDPEIDDVAKKEQIRITAKELGLEHQLFFASDPKIGEISMLQANDLVLYAVVDGDQVIQSNSRLQMRLISAAVINNIHIAKNTPVYGFISFKPNRVQIRIENIEYHPVELKAFDLEDGGEGIYVINGLRARVTKEIVGDMVDEINIAGIPQVSGVKKLFQRDYRNKKVTILNNYKILLKPHL